MSQWPWIVEICLLGTAALACVNIRVVLYPKKCQISFFFFFKTNKLITRKETSLYYDATNLLSKIDWTWYKMEHWLMSDQTRFGQCDNTWHIGHLTRILGCYKVAYYSWCSSFNQCFFVFFVMLASILHLLVGWHLHQRTRALTHIYI